MKRHFPTSTFQSGSVFLGTEPSHASRDPWDWGLARGGKCRPWRVVLQMFWDVCLTPGTAQSHHTVGTFHPLSAAA